MKRKIKYAITSYNLPPKMVRDLEKLSRKNERSASAELRTILRRTLK